MMSGTSASIVSPGTGHETSKADKKRTDENTTDVKDVILRNKI